MMAGWVTAILFMLGFALLILGAEMMVRCATRIAVAAGVPPLVIGLTVVAYGTSAPEAAVSIRAVFADPPRPEISVGNVVGSNIANILLVLGISASIAPLVVDRSVIRRGLPLMLAVTALVFVMASDGVLAPWEGALLVIGSVWYTVHAIYKGRREGLSDQDILDAAARPPLRWSPFWQITIDMVLIAAGLALMTLGADWLVQGATVAARALGVSELVIGLSIVAIGTSLPEVATTVMAMVRGRRDIAVGNVVGSNLFNLLLVLGSCAAVSRRGVTVAPAALQFDFPIMLAVAILCWPVCYSGGRISRWEGAAFLVLFAAYLGLRYFDDSGHPQAATLQLAMLWGVYPSLLFASLFQSVRTWKREHAT